MKISIFFLLFSITTVIATAGEVVPYDKLEFWLDQYSVFSDRAVIVEPNVALASAELLNGKVPAPTGGHPNSSEQTIRSLLLEKYGVEVLDVGEDLAVCRWTFKTEHAAAKDAAQRGWAPFCARYGPSGRVITKKPVTLGASK